MPIETQTQNKTLKNEDIGMQIVQTNNITNSSIIVNPNYDDIGLKPNKDETANITFSSESSTLNKTNEGRNRTHRHQKARNTTSEVARFAGGVAQEIADEGLNTVQTLIKLVRHPIKSVHDLVYGLGYVLEHPGQVARKAKKSFVDHCVHGTAKEEGNCVGAGLVFVGTSALPYVPAMRAARSAKIANAVAVSGHVAQGASEAAMGEDVIQVISRAVKASGAKLEVQAALEGHALDQAAAQITDAALKAGIEVDAAAIMAEAQKGTEAEAAIQARILQEAELARKVDKTGRLTKRLEEATEADAKATLALEDAMKVASVSTPEAVAEAQKQVASLSKVAEEAKTAETKAREILMNQVSTELNGGVHHLDEVGKALEKAQQAHKRAEFQLDLARNTANIADAQITKTMPGSWDNISVATELQEALKTAEQELATTSKKYADARAAASPAYREAQTNLEKAEILAKDTAQAAADAKTALAKIEPDWVEIATAKAAEARSAKVQAAKNLAEGYEPGTLDSALKVASHHLDLERWPAMVTAPAKLNAKLEKMESGMSWVGAKSKSAYFNAKLMSRHAGHVVNFDKVVTHSVPAEHRTAIKPRKEVYLVTENQMK